MPALVVMLGALSGCTKPPDPDPKPERPKAALPAVPEDHVDKDSLAPGKEKAYALVLPYNFAITARVDRTTSAVGMAPSKQVITYIKERVRDGKLIEGDPRTVFEGVRIPEEPDRYLQIVVTARSATTVVTVTDVTPPPELPPVSQPERYKQVGLAPNGQLLHPRTIE